MTNSSPAEALKAIEESKVVTDAAKNANTIWNMQTMAKNARPAAEAMEEALREIAAVSNTGSKAADYFRDIARAALPKKGGE